MDSYEIKILNGDLAGKNIPLESGSFILGRSPEAHIALTHDPKVSSRHCEITLNTEGCFIQDLDSRNGTYVNENRASKRERLKNGDIIRIGSTNLEVWFEIASKSEPQTYLLVEEPLSSSLPSSSIASSAAPAIGSADSVQCRLRHVAEDGQGRLCWITLDQSMEIGRSEWNDYSFSEDIKMSGKHFRVTLAREGCVIEDLHSKHGTWVNGVRVDRCALVHGARIQAGSTVFQVEIVGIQWESLPAAIPVAPQPSSGTQPSGNERWLALRSQMSGGMVRIQGKWEEEPLPVAWIERLLAQKGNVYLLLDPGRFAMDPPEDQQEDPHALFDWLPPVAALVTPRLFDIRKWRQWQIAVEEAWGSDAMMVLASRKSSEELLVHLRKMLRGPENEDSVPDAIQGICWPSVLRSLIEVEVTEFAKEYFSIVDAVWMEGADDPLTWEWTGKPLLLDPLCKSMGIRVRDAVEAKAEG